jgi:hypothetical protein
MEYVASYGIKYLFLVVVLSLGVSFSFAKDNKVLDTSRIDKLILENDPKKLKQLMVFLSTSISVTVVLLN